MSKPNDYDTYIIPPNFIEGGTFFGGLLKLRNTAEALVIVLAIGIPVFSVSTLTLTAKIIILCLTALPLGIIALVGINGESLSSFIFLVLKYLHSAIVTLKEVVPVDIETIGLNIRKCRNAKKMRQEDLAQKANVSSNYISAVERGVKIPSVETLIDIMNALGVSADMIFCDVIDAGVTEKNNQLDAKVSQLSTKDRKTVYDVLDLLVRDLSK